MHAASGPYYRIVQLPGGDKHQYRRAQPEPGGSSDPLEPLRAPGRGGCVAATRGVNTRLVRAGAPRA